MGNITEGEVIALAAALAGSGGGGTGDGDMKKSVYDDDNAVADAGGIKDYVASQITPFTTAQINTLKGLV